MMRLKLNVSHHLLVLVETQSGLLGIKRHPYDISGLVFVVAFPLFISQSFTITFKEYSTIVSMVSKRTLVPTNTPVYKCTRLEKHF